MKKNNGFTLLELVIVIAIIAVVAVLATPRFTAYEETGYSIGPAVRYAMVDVNSGRVK